MRGLVPSILHLKLIPNKNKILTGIFIFCKLAMYPREKMKKIISKNFSRMCMRVPKRAFGGFFVGNIR